MYEGIIICIIMYSLMANLGNDPEFISKEYISIGMRPFGEPKAKP